jgi:hypothetical protein
MLKEENHSALDPKVGRAKEVKQRVDVGNVKIKNYAITN